MTLWFIFWILFGHWYADFVQQTNSMARKKSRSFKWLGKHVITYTCYMMFFAAVAINPLLSTGFMLLWYVLLNGALHFVTDAITSRLTTYFYKNGDRHNFFVTIGFDQFIHMFCLFGTYFIMFGV